MDVIIISTTSKLQEAYWEQHLQSQIRLLINSGAYVIVVEENWSGGAGNGLGTLYAFIKAKEKALRVYDVDLSNLLDQGASIAIYHTSGKGKRLYPLTASARGDKSAILLPGYASKVNLEILQNNKPFISILEAVIKQTSLYGFRKAGRLSVFWGDQLFIPSANIPKTCTAHIEILAKVSTWPTTEEWKEKNLSSYGLLAIGVGSHKISLLDKCSYETITHLIQTKQISVDTGIGISLGSFSLSNQMLHALLLEFEKELRFKSGKFDSDPHFWMPLTLSQELYLDVMKKKGIEHKIALNHFQRMSVFIERFKQQKINESLSVFNVIDIGKAAYWWDYGSLQAYYSNMMKLLEQSDEGNTIRNFFDLENAKSEVNHQNHLQIENSIVINSDIKSGHIKNSIVVGVQAHSIQCENAAILKSQLKTNIKGSNILLYNIQEETDLTLQKDVVRSDVYIENTNEHIKLYTTLEGNGEKDWNKKLEGNEFTFEEVNRKLKT